MSWEGQSKTEGWRKKKENDLIFKRQWGLKMKTRNEMLKM